MKTIADVVEMVNDSAELIDKIHLYLAHDEWTPHDHLLHESRRLLIQMRKFICETQIDEPDE